MPLTPPASFAQNSLQNVRLEVTPEGFERQGPDYITWNSIQPSKMEPLSLRPNPQTQGFIKTFLYILDKI